MRSGSAPAWARSLVLAVCADAGVATPAVLRWRRAARAASSGLASPTRGSIAVTAGSDLADARHTLLHELAHWLSADAARPRRGARASHHGAAFYAVAIPLFTTHGEPMADALRREAGRYPSVLRHARRLGIAEAEAIRGERATARRRAARGPWRVLVPEHPVSLVREGRWYVCATCGRRLVGRTLRRAVRRGRRERHALWTREPIPTPVAAGTGA